MFHHPFSQPADTDEEAGIRLDLEARLQDDHDGTCRRDVLAELATRRTEVRRCMDAGVAPEDYRRLGRVLEAFDAAYGVVETYRGKTDV